MQKNLLNKKDTNLKIAEKHLDKYLFDLQKHFNLSECQIIKILNNHVSKIKKSHVNNNLWQKLLNIFKNNFHKSNNMLLLGNERNKKNN